MNAEGRVICGCEGASERSERAAQRRLWVNITTEIVGEERTFEKSLRNLCGGGVFVWVLSFSYFSVPKEQPPATNYS